MPAIDSHCFPFERGRFIGWIFRVTFEWNGGDWDLVSRELERVECIEDFDRSSVFLSQYAQPHAFRECMSSPPPFRWCRVWLLNRDGSSGRPYWQQAGSFNNFGAASSESD